MSKISFTVLLRFKKKNSYQTEGASFKSPHLCATGKLLFEKTPCIYKLRVSIALFLFHLSSPLKTDMAVVHLLLCLFYSPIKGAY